MPVPVGVRVPPVAMVRVGTQFGPKPTTKLSNSMTMEVYELTARDTADDAVVSADAPVMDTVFTLVFVPFVFVRFCTVVVGSVFVSTGTYGGFLCFPV